MQCRETKLLQRHKTNQKWSRRRGRWRTRWTAFTNEVAKVRDFLNFNRRVRVRQRSIKTSICQNRKSAGRSPSESSMKTPSRLSRARFCQKQTCNCNANALCVHLHLGFTRLLMVHPDTKGDETDAFRKLVLQLGLISSGKPYLLTSAAVAPVLKDETNMQGHALQNNLFGVGSWEVFYWVRFTDNEFKYSSDTFLFSSKCCSLMLSSWFSAEQPRPTAT